MESHKNSVDERIKELEKRNTELCCLLTGLDDALETLVNTWDNADEIPAVNHAIALIVKAKIRAVRIAENED